MSFCWSIVALFPRLVLATALLSSLCRGSCAFLEAKSEHHAYEQSQQHFSVHNEARFVSDYSDTFSFWTSVLALVLLLHRTMHEVKGLFTSLAFDRSDVCRIPHLLLGTRRYATRSCPNFTSCQQCISKCSDDAPANQHLASYSSSPLLP